LDKRSGGSSQQAALGLTETSIPLTLQKIFQSEAELLDGLLVLWLEREVEKGIVERTTLEELEAEVVCAIKAKERAVSADNADM
jgi:hypothetical protein